MARRIKIKDLAKTIEDINTLFLQDFVYELGERVVDRTPVRDGTLKGSNAISLNGAKATIGSPDPSGGGTKSNMRSVAKHADIGDDIYITNGAPYAQEVEKGSSKKAPNGFMLRSATEAQNIAKKSAKKVK